VMLNFSGQVASLASALPSQLSITELRAMIAEQKEILQDEQERHRRKIEDISAQIQSLEEGGSSARLASLEESLDDLLANPPVNFYHRYYRAELSKKYALSAACTLLVLLTFSLSFFRLKHGRLIGFGLSMLASVLYWYILFFSQMQIFDSALPVELWIWLANIVMTILGLVGLSRARRL